MGTSMSVIKTSKNTMRAWYSEDLKRHGNLMKLLGTYSKVHLHDNDNYPEKLVWCLEHCQGKFRDIKHGDGMYWYFELEQDAALFALKWS